MTVFEWDEVKAESNLKKHGIGFEDAIEAFYDPTRWSSMTGSQTASCAGRQLVSLKGLRS